MRTDTLIDRYDIYDASNLYACIVIYVNHSTLLPVLALELLALCVNPRTQCEDVYWQFCSDIACSKGILRTKLKVSLSFKNEILHICSNYL